MMKRRYGRFITGTDDTINDLLLMRANEIEFRKKLVGVFILGTSKFPKIKFLKWFLLFFSGKKESILEIGFHLQKSRERQLYFESCLDEVSIEIG